MRFKHIVRVVADSIRKNFNSILVRFKLHVGRAEGRVPAFQFYISAIQTGWEDKEDDWMDEFQFYISAIQTLVSTWMLHSP